MSASDEKDIFAAARRLASGGERHEYLDRACGDDRRLRARLDALLRVETEDDAFLTTPAAVLTPPAGEGPGTVIGPYTLVERLGEGGFAVVFRAEQAQPLRREVAVKVLKPGMDSRQVVARFEAERQALALMDHPGIAKVLDAGQLDSGRPYFVMELVRGVPVTEFCDAARLPVRDRLALAVGVCHAVQHAHQKGVIHRDLKPSNVLATSHDGTPAVKVIDFGVAKALDTRLTEQSLHTHTGQLVGTPLYMSPEQMALDGTDIDTRADVYALGVLLYELLSGAAPFDRGRMQAAGFDELRRVVREEEPARPSTRITADAAAGRRSDPRRLSRELAGELDWIVMKALEKDRDRRYPSADALARDIQRYLADEPVEARPPSVAYRLGKLLRRHRGPAVAAAVVALALAGGLAGTTWGLFRAEQARARERQAKETAEKRLTQIEKGIDVLAAVFGDLDPFAEEKEGKTLRAILAERLDRAAAELDGESVGDPLVVAKLQGRLAGTYLGLGQPAKAERLYAKAWATLREELGDDDPISLGAGRALAWARQSAGQRIKALALFRQVADAQERLLGADHPDTLATLVNLGEACRLSGRAAEALPLMERARAGAEAQFPPDHPLVLAALDGLAAAYTVAGGEPIDGINKTKRRAVP
ncbi:MAG: protein kinase domain-containing protein [Gemmataceae bacterium]